METFTESPIERHPTELAMLRGARLVIAQETEKGRHWAESKIKALTDGSPVTARFMRQDHFEFTPQFKLMIAGNHKPSLRTVDEAIRRRIQMIPFTVTIPPAERDLQLFDKLKPEWPGILRWALNGCLEWQKIGLAPPATVTAATDAYIAEEDSFRQWIDECCVTGPQHFGKGAQLWASWNRWAERSNERPGTRKGFAQALADRGFEAAKEKEVRGYKGIALVPSDDLAERADLL
jgi:putative DNA primase/helicase